MMASEKLFADFYSLFMQSYENIRKNKEKAKNSSESNDENVLTPIVFEISTNASKFSAFAGIRSLVHEHEIKFKTLHKLDTKLKSIESKNEENNAESRNIDNSQFSVNNFFIPHIVSAGIQTLFDIISETKHQNPTICTKALLSLFDVFQGHDPESLKSEPDVLFHSLYDLLLELATWPGPQKSSSKENIEEKRNWSAISCSVLLSLCIARGDTGKIIKAITSILMSSNSLLTQSIKLPDILIKLQKSVECAALGKLEKPRFYEYGVPKDSLIDEFPVKNLTSEIGSSSLSLASDGKFLYILHGKSLYKIGSGYSGTTKGLIYKMNLDFTKDKRGWIGFCQNKLYYKKVSKRTIENFIFVDREMLTLQNPLNSSVPPSKRDANNFTLYSDGDSINTISAIKDSFVIREIIPPTSDFPFDITLNLSKRSFKTFGYTPFEEEILNHSQLQKIQSTFNCFVPALPDEAEVCGIVSGKEFGLVMTSNSKVFYYGKGASLGMKSLIKSPSLKLSELTISKVSKIVHSSLFHDGLHALLLSNDGSVFFAGTARRGEDGEISKRRLLKPIKPKRISRLDNHFIVHISSNNGTSAFVTKTGKLIMYGKDTGFCDSHGIVSQLHDQHIVKIALGKAHAIALNSKGEIFSFGVNNKGQCGRTFSQIKEKSAQPSASNTDFLFKQQMDKGLQRHVHVCEVDEHEVVEDYCKICKICFECTGYNKMCSAASKITIKNRIGGSKCFCGHGNSGCVKCGACSTCITKQESDLDNHIVIVGSPPLHSDKQKLVVRKEVRIDTGDEVNVSNESERVAPLAPGKVSIASSSPVVQISCGLHHTVVLTAAGDVFTFGSNQYGQLGTGNLEATSTPVLVKIPAGTASQVAAGSNHTVVLSSNGVVYTFGNNQKGQLGRQQAAEIQSTSQTPTQGSKSSNHPFTFSEFQFLESGDILTQRQRLNCIATAITGIGPNFRKKACWISASGDQTFIKIDESLINASYLNRISIAANKNTIVFISNNEDIPGCITINKHDGKCITHNDNQFPFFDIAPIPPLISDHDTMNTAESTNPFLNARLGGKESGDHSSSSSSPSSSSITTINNTVFTFDPLYDVLWGFDVSRKTVMCFNILASKVLAKKASAIFKADITLPKKNSVDITRVQACLNILACLDTLAFDSNILDTCFDVDSNKAKQTKNVETLEALKESKETKKICRFDAFGGGWGYFGHSVEAVRFMCDTDIVMDGIGMYGGRGEYTCKIKLFDLDFDGGAVEKEGNLVLEIEDVPYYCPARTIHNIMFQKPVSIVAGKWYLMWVKVSGPSSDCGSSGQNIVVGDDQVVFTFKSSKKSNNGTDINSGQIPSILYRVVTHDRKMSTEISRSEEICKISKQFINKISPESFENLVKLLNWSWSQFKQKVNEVEVERISSNDELLINRYVYICQVCLRLLKKYINEIYPSDSFKGLNGENDTSTVNKSFHANVDSSTKNQLPTSSLSVLSETGVSVSSTSKKINVENIQLAENIVNVRTLLITILCDDLTNTFKSKKSNLIFDIMDECNNTFVSCFNAFYPTSYLKWDCLCDLLSQLDKGILHSRLLSSVLAGLAYDPTVNLKATFSIMSSHAAEHKALTSPSENSGQPILQNAENYPYPVLVEQMMYNTQKEKSNPVYSAWNFKEILTRLLDIISRPIKLKIESVYNNSKMDLVSSEYLRRTNDFNLISNCCFLLSKTLAEIVYQSSTTDTDPTVVSPYVLQSTNVRFKKSDYSKTWNTGNFASDAICFTVDRPGIVLAGCCVYYGSGSYEYQLELFHDTLDSKSLMQHKWETIETSYGKFDQENVHRNMVQLKFERPVPIRENTCYALRYCSQGARTCSGDSGYQFVRGPCGTVFRFYPCDLSFNGTSPHRGQLPSLLYYSVPMSHQGSKLKNNKEMLARDIALEFASDVIQRSCDLLILARSAFLYALSSSSDKSSSNSSNTTQTFDSEHNITPIEEHFDVSWMSNPQSTVTSAPMIKQTSFPYYSSSSAAAANSKDPTNINFKDVSKKIETFSRGIMETLKLDKKFDRNSDCVEIKIDNASEVNPNDFFDEERAKKKANEDAVDSNINGNNTTKKATILNQIEKSESCESLGADREKLNEMFTMEESSLFHTLLPLTVAHLSRLICSDPKISVEILNLVKMILPQISLWNQISNKNVKSLSKTDESCNEIGSRLSTTSNHYAVIESDHPYKWTSIYSYKIEFPANVKWMSLEFDPQCGTAQPEDCLKIFIPVKSQNFKSASTNERGKVKIQKNMFTNENSRQQNFMSEQQQILIKKFNTENSWPTNLIIVPGNEISLSLETASNYLTDHKLNRYGFKCILIGYENIDMSKTFNNSLVNLESEFAYLGGMCSANLMRKDLIFSDEKTDDFWATENILKKHSVLLSKGLSIRDGSLTMNNILEYDIIDTEQSHEKQFLKDFVFVTPDTAGGRLASWIQPESRLDPNRCELKLFQDPIQSGWPTKLVIETRDQYGDIVYVPNMKIQLKITQSSSSFSNEKRFNKMFKDQPAFSPLPKVSYEPVVKEKEKIRIKSITAMKAFSQYSFEELRMFTPVQQKTSSDLITAKDSGDLCYSVMWTPECASNFVINIIIDGVQVNENYTIPVINANIPPPVKEHALKKIQPQYKYRKFYAEYSAGLRVRLHPTLQADQIGVIKINDVISYIDEMENSDGIWVKLSTDSIRKFCSTSWCSSEAWCLAYNKHFNKRLLYSLIEPNKEKSTPNPKDDMNNVKSFEEENGSAIENEQEEMTKKVIVDDATSSSDREEDDKPPTFEELSEESADKTSQSNITAAIAGVVEGSANKLQAFQKWLRRDSIGETNTVQRRNGSIPEAYNNNTLDLKKTNIDNLADKLSNDIITSPLVERIIPTSRVNRTFDKESYPSRNSINSQTNSESKNRRQLDYDENNTPKQALSPSVAETIRAIFAAFLWHEGLVHDAIACASFLKFHPSIPKNNVFEMDQTIVEQRLEALTKEDKIQQRHSVEIINTTNYLNARPSTLEALTKSGYCCVHYRRQRGKAKEIHRSSENIEIHGCPPALKCLVFVWDELNKDFQAFINKFMFDRENKDRRIFSRLNSETKFQVKSTIDEGATGGSSNSIWCDLCNSDINQQGDGNAFTNHLKKAHPGCGESAKGKGYNANGVYCEGWAGQCGEEGIGATSWYLLCESCRDRSMMPVKKTNKLYVNNSLSTKTIQESQEAAACPLPNANVMNFNKKAVKSFSNYNFEIFGTMRDNALFLLDLNSHNGTLLTKAPGNDLIALKSKTCVRQNSLGDFRTQNASPSHRFSSTFVEEKLRKATLQKQIHSSPCYNAAAESSGKTDFLWSPPETITCLDVLNSRVGESESCNNFSSDNGKNFSMIGQNPIRPTNLSNENKFHRSFSMVQGWDFYSTSNDNQEETGSSQWMEINNQTQNRDSQVVMRRKKKCLCDSMTDASLLNYPSKNLKRLVPEYIYNPTLSGFSEVSSSHDIKNDSQLDSSLEVKRSSEKSLQVAFAPSPHIEENSPQFSLLNRPTISFIFEKHDLDKLRYLLRKNLRKALCSVYGLQALNWLLRSVTQLMCVHDIMWWFISSLVQTKTENEGVLKLEDFDICYEHPVAISNVDDRIQILLSQNLHMLLQSISDVTLSLPSGSALQRLAIQCFCIKFRPSDHQFLHNSHVFGNISKILSKSEELNDENVLFSMEGLFDGDLPLNASTKLAKDRVQVHNYVDITDAFEFTISSRQAMVSALTDNSTETFWESDDEDRNKPKIIEISMIKPHFVCKSINIHIDNCRDLAYKVTNFSVYSGLSLGELNFLETVETESNIGSWYQVLIKDDTNTHFRIELRGVENNIRVRQIKILGHSNEAVKKNQELSSAVKKHTSPHHIQQKYCEQETLRVFRVLSNQVFGKLIINQEHPLNNPSFSNLAESNINSPGCDSLDLREHMVGILFSRSKLTHLQKQIIVHIVHSIQKEAQKSHDEWEAHVKTICSTSVVKSTSSEVGYSKFSDVYCFEMLSMVLALSGSSVGRSYLSHQNDLIKDLLCLLHTGSERVQRQVILLLRRILPEISPEIFCSILDIPFQPNKDVNYLLQNPKQIKPQNLGILDHLLAIIAKSLQIQVKLKNTSGIVQNKNQNVRLSDYILPLIRPPIGNPAIYQHQISSGTEGGESNASYSSSKDYDLASGSASVKEATSTQTRWFLYGTASTKLAENIICLIKDMMNGKLTEKWSNVTKTAVAECIINLSHMNEENRQPENCLKTHTLWLALSALCVLSEDHVAKLSSSQWSKSSGGADKRPLCTNHDDSITNAVIECTECGTLCCDCDRFLHLNRKTWTHHRTVCKEEEEAIKVELHETCGRIKLFWLLALADRKTLKGIVEFRDGHNIVICDPNNAVGRCRFCGTYGNTGLLAVGNVCVEPQCQEYSANACTKILQCGHFCGGINEESSCLPCLHQKCQSSLQFDPKRPKLTQDSDDMCMICFTEALSCAPSIQMACGHVFHYHCSRLILKKRWNGARISFAFSQCPICKNDINHESLKDLLEPINALKEDVKRKALMRLKYEGIDKDLIDDHRNLSIHAMERYAYYVCCKCQKAYYGGEARCDVEMGENFNPDELVCGGCSDIAKAQMCPKHGSDFLEYKCRYCCSVAVFFCFGTTHFCDTCHDDFQRLTNIPKIKLPKCPAGPKATQLVGDECPLHIVHPPTGEEFALGCGICRNFHSF